MTFPLVDCIHFSEAGYKKINTFSALGDFTLFSESQIETERLTYDVHFFARAFFSEKSNSIVISYSGTDNNGHMRANWSLYSKGYSTGYFKLAALFFEKIYQQHLQKKPQYFVTGHSLGASCASYVSYKYGIPGLGVDCPGFDKFNDSDIVQKKEDHKHHFVHLSSEPNIINTLWGFDGQWMHVPVYMQMLIDKTQQVDLDRKALFRSTGDSDLLRHAVSAINTKGAPFWLPGSSAPTWISNEKLSELLNICSGSKPPQDWRNVTQLLSHNEYSLNYFIFFNHKNKETLVFIPSGQHLESDTFWRTFLHISNSVSLHPDSFVYLVGIDTGACAAVFANAHFGDSRSASIAINPKKELYTLPPHRQQIKSMNLYWQKPVVEIQLPGPIGYLPITGVHSFGASSDPLDVLWGLHNKDLLLQTHYLGQIKKAVANRQVPVISWSSQKVETIQEKLVPKQPKYPPQIKKLHSKL